MQPQSLTRQPSQQLQTQQRQQARQSLSQPTPPPAQSQAQPHFQRIQTQPRPQPQLTRPHVQHLSSHRPSPSLTRTNPAPLNQGEQPQDLSTTRPSRGSLLPSREVRDEGVKAEGRRDPASESREVSRGGSNSNSRPSSSLPPRPTGASGAGVGLVTGADGRARLRAEPEAAGDDRELRDIVPQSAVPCPSREETVESRTAVSERVS
ncbi:hypothetical protein OYC64_014241 [Pagothenia borchgrevinki]